MAIFYKNKYSLFYLWTLEAILGITRIIYSNHADYTCYRTIFLTHFQLTECCNFVHNSMLFTHPKPDFVWAEIVLIVYSHSIRSNLWHLIAQKLVFVMVLTAVSAGEPSSNFVTVPNTSLSLPDAVDCSAVISISSFLDFLASAWILYSSSSISDITDL